MSAEAKPDNGVARHRRPQRATPGWMLAGRGGLNVEVPEGDVAPLESVIGALAAEVERPPDARSAELERQLLSVLLLRISRAGAGEVHGSVTDCHWRRGARSPSLGGR